MKKPPYTAQIVEGVMNRVLHAIALAHLGDTQTYWGPEWSDSGLYTSLDLRNVKVIVETCASAEEESIMHVQFGGHRVSTWLDTKRPFYHAHVPAGWNDHVFVDWARRVFEDLQ